MNNDDKEYITIGKGGKPIKKQKNQAIQIQTEALNVDSIVLQESKTEIPSRGWETKEVTDGDKKKNPALHTAPIPLDYTEDFNEIDGLISKRKGRDFYQNIHDTKYIYEILEIFSNLITKQITGYNFQASASKPENSKMDRSTLFIYLENNELYFHIMDHKTIGTRYELANREDLKLTLKKGHSFTLFEITSIFTMLTQEIIRKMHLILNQDIIQNYFKNITLVIKKMGETFYHHTEHFQKVRHLAIFACEQILKKLNKLSEEQLQTEDVKKVYREVLLNLIHLYPYQNEEFRRDKYCSKYIELGGEVERIIPDPKDYGKFYVQDKVLESYSAPTKFDNFKMIPQGGRVASIGKLDATKDGISWDNVPDLSVLTGVNGCGKTRLLNSISHEVKSVKNLKFLYLNSEATMLRSVFGQSGHDFKYDYVRNALRWYFDFTDMKQREKVFSKKSLDRNINSKIALAIVDEFFCGEHKVTDISLIPDKNIRQTAERLAFSDGSIIEPISFVRNLCWQYQELIMNQMLEQDQSDESSRLKDRKAELESYEKKELPNYEQTRKSFDKDCSSYFKKNHNIISPIENLNHIIQKYLPYFSVQYQWTRDKWIVDVSDTGKYFKGYELLFFKEKKSRDKLTPINDLSSGELVALKLIFWSYVAKGLNFEDRKHELPIDKYLIVREHLNGVNFQPRIEDDKYVAFEVDGAPYKIKPEPKDLDQFKNIIAKIEAPAREEVKYSEVTEGDMKWLISKLELIQSPPNKLKLLLLDEVDKHFDPKLTRSLIDIIQEEFVNNGVQVFITTHRPDTLSLVSNRDYLKKLKKEHQAKIYTLEKEGEAVKIAETHPLLAMFRVSESLKDITGHHHVVYAESRDDALFYEGIYQTLMRHCDVLRDNKELAKWQGQGTPFDYLLSRRFQLSFSSVSNDGDGGGGYSRVIEYVASDIIAYNNLKTPQKELDISYRKDTSLFYDDFRLCGSYGIIDRDYGVEHKVDIIHVAEGRNNIPRIVTLYRHSLENYIFDPFIFSYLLGFDDILEKFRTNINSIPKEQRSLKTSIKDICRELREVMHDGIEPSRSVQDILSDYFRNLIELLKTTQNEEISKYRTYYPGNHPPKKIRLIVDDNTLTEEFDYPHLFIELRGHNLGYALFGEELSKQVSCLAAQKIHSRGLKYIPVDLAIKIFELNSHIRAHVSEVLKPRRIKTSWSEKVTSEVRPLQAVTIEDSALHSEKTTKIKPPKVTINTLDDGTKIYSNGIVTLADGTEIHTRRKTKGMVTLSDGTRILQNGIIHLSGGIEITGDKEIIYNKEFKFKGNVQLSDGRRIENGNVFYPDVLVIHTNEIRFLNGITIDQDRTVILADGRRIENGKLLNSESSSPEGKLEKAEGCFVKSPQDNSDAKISGSVAVACSITPSDQSFKEIENKLIEAYKKSYLKIVIQDVSKDSIKAYFKHKGYDSPDKIEFTEQQGKLSFQVGMSMKTILNPLAYPYKFRVSSDDSNLRLMEKHELLHQEITSLHCLKLISLNNNFDLFYKMKAERLFKPNFKNIKSIEYVVQTQIAFNLKGGITLFQEVSHKLHFKNVLILLRMFNCNEIQTDTIICLERKQNGNNLGMPDVIALANYLEQGNSLPSSLQLLPIYHDALLYNAAKAKIVQVIGIDGKGLAYSKESPYYHQAREEYMAEQLVAIAKTGKNAIFLVGAAHINKLLKLLGKEGFYVEGSNENAGEQSFIKLKPIEQEESFFTWQFVIYSAGSAYRRFKILDTTVDSLRLAHIPTLENAKKVLFDSSYIYSMYTGVNGYSSAITGVDIAYKIYNGEYAEALDQFKTAASYMLLPMAIGYNKNPYIAFGYIAGITIYSVKNTVSNVYSFYQEYYSKDFYTKSYSAYKDFFETLASSPLAYFYSFTLKAKEYEVKLNNIKLELDKAYAKEQLEEKGEFGHKLYEYIYSSLIEEKYDLQNKVVQGILTQEEADGLKAKHIKVLNYDHCMEVVEFKEEESSDHYYCYNEKQEVLDHIIIVGEAVLEKIGSL